MEKTLFDRTGGFAKVRKIVSGFYDKVLDSPRLAPYFEGIDMPALVDHQTKFVAYLLGGPAAYTDEQIRRVHAELDVSRADFAEMVDLLCEALEDHDLAAADIADVRRRLQAREHLIVPRQD